MGKAKKYIGLQCRAEAVSAKCVTLYSFCFFHHVRSKRGNIYIKVIEDKQDNCGKHDNGRKTKVISPADGIHNLAHKGLI